MSETEQGVCVLSFEVDGMAGTEAWAHHIAGILRRGDTLFLKGDLGAGKTALARALIQAMSPESVDVPSPTFTLVQTYPALLNGEPATCWHTDLYRLESPAEIIELGLEDALEEGILLVEWPERAPSMLPDDALQIHISVTGETKRHMDCYGPPSWQLRLEGLSATTE